MLGFAVMSARAIASATVSFGMVSIPVKVYSSGESAAPIHFNMVHAKCGSRLKQQYVCPKEDVIVGRDDMARGYEFAKGQYVLFTEQELKALQEKPTQSVEITEFLPTEKVDPIYFDKCYYLGPGKGGDRAFKLLARALAKSGRSALAKYAARGKQYLVLIRPLNDALVMQQLRYADEIRPIAEVPLGDAVVKPAELKLALQIVDQAVAEQFRPEAYEDEVRKRIQEQIDRKVDGQEISLEPEEEPRAQVIDLMEALKSSLAEKAGDRRPAKRAASAKTQKAAKNKKSSSG
jgi:DNA end-binding protein Ku